jgi:hypothetical protein
MIAVIDISEIWDNFALIAGLLVAVALVIVSLRVGKRWLRNTALVLSSFLFLVFGGLLYLVGCEMVDSNARIPGIFSPDRRHIAVVRWWLPGAVGSDMVHVSIRRVYSPIAVEVETGAAEPPDPKVEWLDDHRLLITYWGKGEVGHCSHGVGRVDGIEVLCKE